MTVDILSNAYKDTIDAIYLLSGDGDFLQLTKDLPGIRIIVICQKGNYNKKLTDTVSEAYSVEFLISNYRSAWYLGSS